MGIIFLPFGSKSVITCPFTDRGQKTRYAPSETEVKA